MTLAADTIAALRTEHDTLAALVVGLPDDRLTGPSGASEWTVAQVLSHLGSGAEIALATVRAALGDGEVPGDDFNRTVWDRWDSSTAQQQRDGFVEHDEALVAALEALTAEQHDTLRISLGFLPAPLSVTGYTGMRLNEVAHHSWDVRVAADPAAGLLDSSTDALLGHMSGDLGFLLGFIGRADAIDQRVVLGIDDRHRLRVDEAVAFGDDGEETTATFQGPPEAALRLLTGRLRPEHTPAGVAVTGNVTLDDLRRVFPGF